MDLYQAIKGRRAIRKYKTMPVSKDVVMKVLDAANWAPSGVNAQPWKFYIVQGAKRDALTASYGAMVEKNYPPAGERTEQQQFFLDWAKNYGGAPIIMVFTQPKEEKDGRRKMHLESVSAAFQNMLLAAYAEGLGTCWMTGPLGDEATVRSVVGIPDSEEIVALTPLGYPDQVVGDKPRLDPELKEKAIWVE
ncbi:MAG: nitroreductase family protein [Bacillota bacterium]